MKKLLIIAVLAFVTSSARAQYISESIFAGPTPSSGVNAPAPSGGFGIIPSPVPAVPAAAGTGTEAIAGLGGEYRFKPHWGAGADISGLFPVTGTIIRNTVGTLEPSGYYHFLPRINLGQPRIDVYAVAGYTLLLQSYAASGIHGGAGLTYWFHERYGALLEFRYVHSFQDSTPVANYYEVRLGFVIRQALKKE